MRRGRTCIPASKVSITSRHTCLNFGNSTINPHNHVYIPALLTVLRQTPLQSEAYDNLSRHGKTALAQEVAAPPFDAGGLYSERLISDACLHYRARGKQTC
ncbi:unnamed protein product [Protopolystoma xenopodis]|uniref:Uncharacterized protein n=1 Tax=Protopolystoma xenopodis TaxID=117903 RepID=A0A3S5AVQ3_9PLAT|nr:unnamed protein product [Protopolystoma xenopodis]